MSDTFDYIIIGAGSAGCVLANRLSADKNNRVLLLEAGGSDHSLWVQMPLGYGRTFNDPNVNWRYQTEAEPALAGRSGYWPRGKVLGGSGSINAMVYIRGLPLDFDRWRDAGNPGWGWEDVLPVFKRSESFSGGDSGWHGRDGELKVTDISAGIHPLNQSFMQAAAQCGYPRTSDFNGPQMEGVGIYAINTHRGLRASTANCFLRPVLSRPNLQVRLHAAVHKVLFAPANREQAPHATGVEYIKQGQTFQVHARRAVILSGGAINSPQLLQLSGIGQPELLNRLAIPLVAEHPAVGQHLQDHLCLTHQYKSRQPTLNNELYPLAGKVKIALQYLFGRRGILGMSVNQAGGFVRSDPGQSAPNLQLYFNTLTYKPAMGRQKLINPDPFAAFSLSFHACRPDSRGHLTLRSPDPDQPPRIVPNSLSAEKDVQEAIAGCKILRELAGSPPLAELISSEMLPGTHVQSDDELLADFRERAGTIYHPAGTCRMGSNPADSVVDARLKVHGTGGLYVVDASVFPFLTSGNTHAPTVMVAEKGAAMILQDQATRTSHS